MSVHAVLAQTGGLGSPLVVLLFPILFGILLGGPLLALAGIVLAVWRRGSPVWGARIPRWLGLYAFAADTALIAYMLATKEFPAPAIFEWPARIAMVLGLLAMTLGVRPLLVAPEARRRGASWVVVMVALVAAALVVEREGWRRQIREDLVEAARDGDAAAVQAAIDGGVDEATRVQMLSEAATYWGGPRPRVEVLLRAGTNPNARDRSGVSPWQRVVGNWRPDPERRELIRLFLAHGADPNGSWDRGTPAYIAWAKGDAELLGQLRGAGARDADTHEPRFRSLVDAVRSGDLATVRALREAGVPWTHGGPGGMDVPIAAGEEGRTEVLRSPGYWGVGDQRFWRLTGSLCRRVLSNPTTASAS